MVFQQGDSHMLRSLPSSRVPGLGATAERVWHRLICAGVALALALCAVALSPAPAYAGLIQGSENWQGWCPVIPGQVGLGAVQDCRATPLDACQAQYDWWAHPELFP